MSSRPGALAVRKTAYPMATVDKVAFSFDAEEAITAATAQLLVLPGRTAATGSTVTTSALAQGATVTVSGLTIDTSYELRVTFTRSDSTKWSRTLNIECVA